MLLLIDGYRTVPLSSAFSERVRMTLRVEGKPGGPQGALLRGEHKNAAPFEAASARRPSYPCVGCKTRNVVPPLDQTSTSASSPLGTLESSCCTSAAECTG